ncbi:MAG: hypothetical protein J6R79_01105 [Bacteroidaceae bacterium]|nr:hypothetical protein [Bacteroidaceae bacterium]
MKRLFLLIVSSLLFLNLAEAQKRVVDALDNSPVTSAPIFNAAGNVIGMTSNEGDFSDISESAYPITIRCIGYESVTVEQPKDTIIMMLPALYELEEVVVSAKREVLKLTAYVREYFTISSQTDTIAYFAEHMADRYMPADENIKFNKNSLRLRNTRCYSHFKGEDLDSVGIEHKTTFPSVLSSLQAIDKPVKVPDSFKNQEGVTKSYEVPGKSGTTFILKQNAHTHTIIGDALAEEEDHRMSLWIFKLLGVAMDIEQLYITRIYNVNDTGVYLPKDLIQASVVMEAEGKGKLLRQMLRSETPVTIHSSVELYVVDREYLSKKKAKEEYKDKMTKIEFEIPESVPELDEATKRLIKRANALK